MPVWAALEPSGDEEDFLTMTVLIAELVLAVLVSVYRVPAVMALDDDCAWVRIPEVSGLS